VENVKDRYTIEHIQNCESECQWTFCLLALVCAQDSKDLKKLSRYWNRLSQTSLYVKYCSSGMLII